jgi:hypothetical protein
MNISEYKLSRGEASQKYKIRTNPYRRLQKKYTFIANSIDQIIQFISLVIILKNTKLKKDSLWQTLHHTRYIFKTFNFVRNLLYLKDEDLDCRSFPRRFDC